MKLIVLLCFWALPAFALTPVVFMRENAQGKQIIMKSGEVETQLTQDKNWHLYPDISADGKWIVWVEGVNDKNLSVVLYNVEKQTREKFETSKTGMTLQPRLSKNGEFIFFSAPATLGNKIVFFNPQHSRQRVDRRERDGTRVFRLQTQSIAHDGAGYFPRPSSDGSFVVFQRNTLTKKEIVEFNRMTNETKVLAEGMAPALSADEKWVLYTSKVNGSWDIWITNRSTGDKVALTNDPKDEMAPTFMPNNTVAFASNKTGKFQIYKISNGDWIQIVESDSDDYAPMFAGDVSIEQTLKTPFPAPMRSSLGALNHEGKIYLCGGHQGAEHTYPPESFTDTMQVYDPATGSWKVLAPRPHKAHGFQMAGIGRYIYAFGGFAYDENNSPKWKSIAAIDRYDIESDTWTTVGLLPRRRSSNVSITVDNKVYLIGGWDSTPKFNGDLDGTFQQAVDVFDLKTEKVSVARWQMPLPLRRAFSAVEYGGNIILVGGLGVGASHFELLNNITMIEPVSGYSRELSPLPFATFAPASGVMGDELFVFGGMFKTGAMDYEYVSHIYAMDLKKETWRHTGRFLSENKGFSQVVPFEEGLAVIGGHHYLQDRDEPLATFEFFKKVVK
ncbi:MAG: hypothetical protein K2P81_06420 [Bacteriovoracaceae bacterium]|nr:hypothetical protein [Bacteriovoracaceae bacterium]